MLESSNHNTVDLVQSNDVHSFSHMIPVMGTDHAGLTAGSGMV